MNYRRNNIDDKYRSLCLYPGAWNGAIIHTGTPFPMKSTTTKKLIRFKVGLARITETSKTAEATSTVKLRKLAGLGVNVAKVHSDAWPYLKGFFNAMEAFRSNRDVDGWRLQEAMDEAAELDALDEAPLEVVLEDYPEDSK